MTATVCVNPKSTTPKAVHFTLTSSATVPVVAGTQAGMRIVCRCGQRTCADYVPPAGA